jgi:hypothetical protein
MKPKYMAFLMVLALSFIWLDYPASADTKDVHTSGTLVIGDAPFNEVLYVGPETRHFHTGNVHIKNSGTLWVDGGEFHLQGKNTNIYVTHQAKMIFQNGALLHYEQAYVSQHRIIARNSGGIELYNTHVNCDGSIEFVELWDNSSFTATDTIYDDWTTWYVHDRAYLTLDSVTYAGDIVFYDSPTIRIKDTSTVMPWLHFPTGAVVDTEFPPPRFWPPVSKIINNDQPGFSGIPWSLEVENSIHVLWGIHPTSGSDVTIRNTNPMTMVLFPFMGTGIFKANDVFQNEKYYDDIIVPVSDRRLRLVDTRVTWWKVDAREWATLFADNIIFSEMMIHNRGKVFATNSTCEGQTVHMGAKDNGFVYFKDGEVWTFVSTWQNATMVLDNTQVDWTKGDFVYQTRNIAHGQSRLYCLNTTFEDYLPEAVDAALAMYARIEFPEKNQTVAKGPVPVYGSAWTQRGPLNPHLFQRYELAYTASAASGWKLIKSSRTPLDRGILGWWDTSSLPAGRYQLKLTIYVYGKQKIHPTDKFPVIIRDINVE